MRDAKHDIGKKSILVLSLDLMLHGNCLGWIMSDAREAKR